MSRPERLLQTGLDLPDEICAVTILLHSVLEKPTRVFLQYFFHTCGFMIAIPFIEAARADVPPLLSHPVIAGLVMQIATAPIGVPLYFLLFVHCGFASLHFRPQPAKPSAKIDQAQAEALLFGFVMGYIIPTVLFFALENPYMTIIWRLTPIWVSAFQQLHLFFRPSSKYPESGYRTVQALYIIIFLQSAIAHRHFLLRLLFDRESLSLLFLPSLSPLLQPAIGTEPGVLELIKWECYLAYIATAAAAFWLNSDLHELTQTVIWLVIGTVTFGPGGAMIAIWLWRESWLNGSLKQLEEAKAKQGRT